MILSHQLHLIDFRVHGIRQIFTSAQDSNPYALLLNHRINLEFLELLHDEEHQVFDLIVATSMVFNRKPVERDDLYIEFKAPTKKTLEFFRSRKMPMVECRQPIGFSEAAIAIDDQANVVWLGTSFHLMQQIAFVNTIEDGRDFHPDMTPYSVSGRIIPKPFAVDH